MPFDTNEIARRRQLGSTINRSHPLMRNCVFASLLNEGSGGVYNLGNKNPGLYARQISWDHNYWSGSSIGVCPRFMDANSSGGRFQTPTGSTIGHFRETDNFSVWFYMTKLNTSTAGAGICAIYDAGEFFNRWLLFTDNATPQVLTWSTSGGVVTGSISLSDFKPGEFHSICAVNNGSTGKLQLFVDTKLDIEDTAPTISSGFGTFNFCGDADGNRRPRCSFGGFLMWDRALSPTEVSWLALEPFSWVHKPIYRKFFLPSVFSPNFHIRPEDSLLISDALSLVGPPPDYFLLLGESLSNIQDSQASAIGILQQFTDSVNNAVDAVATMLGIPIEAFDSQQFNWADAIDTLLVGALISTFSDSVNNLSDSANVVRNNVLIPISVSSALSSLLDAIQLNNTIRKQFGDNLVLSDALQMRYTNLLRVAETINLLAEALNMKYNASSPFADSVNNLNDSVSVALAGEIRVTADN
jgi:hypothetical protein